MGYDVSPGSPIYEFFSFRFPDVYEMIESNQTARDEKMKLIPADDSGGKD